MEANSQSTTAASGDGWDARIDLGYRWLEEGCYVEVLDSCENWLSLKPGQLRRADVLTLRGNTCKRLGRRREALLSHKHALNIRTMFLGPSSEPVARSCQNLFNIYWDLGDYGNAAFFAEKNLSIRQSLYGQEDPSLVIPTLNLGDALLRLNRTQEAATHFSTGYKIQIRSIGYATTMTATLQTRLADCQSKSGDFVRALDSLKTAWQLFQSLPESTSLDKARCLVRMGDCAFEIGDNQAAGQYYNSALGFTQDSSIEKVKALNALGRLYRVEKEYDSAIDLFNQAAMLCDTAPAAPKVYLQLYIDCMLQLGTTYLDIGELDGAVSYVEKAIKRLLKTKEQGELLASARLKLGRCRLLQSQNAEANVLFRQVVEWASAHRNTSMLFSAHFYLGEMALLEKDLKSAINSYNSALQSLGHQGVFPYEEIQVKAVLATTYERLAMQSGSYEQWKKANLIALEGITDLESLKGRLADEQSMLDVQSAFYQLYSTAIASTLALNGNGAGEQAFKLSERYREGQFQKFSYLANIAAGNNKLYQPTRQLRHNLAAARQERATLLGSPTYPLQQEEAKRLDSLILVLESQLADLEKNVNTSSSFSIAKPSSLRKSLKNDQTLLQYHWGEYQLYAFIFTADTFIVNVMQLPNDLDSNILRFNFLCSQNPQLLSQDSQTQMAQLSHQIYATVVAPLRYWLKPQLTIAPDAWLYYVPFDALLTLPPKTDEPYWQHHYMIKSHSIGYCNSASLYEGIRRLQSTSTYNFIGIAPIFEDDSRQLTQLYNNGREVSAAKKALGGKTIEGKSATKSSALSWLAQSQIVLFSTHAILNDQRPDASYLAFTEVSDSLDNASLYAWEIYNLPMSSDLVVLSACQTANGQMYRGEGLMSIARAFQHAGISTVVASLWNVDDEQTPELMAKYFEFIAEGMPRKLALTEAKRFYLENAKSLKTYPFFWSGFVSIGNDEPIDVAAPKPTWRLGAVAFALMLMILVIYYWQRRCTTSCR